MVRAYELMFIVRPELDDDAVRASVDSVEAVVAGLGGQIHKTTMWGKRRLAYEVARLRDGHYVIFRMSLEGDRVKDLERALRIHDTVFRHLLVVDEAKPEEVHEAGDDAPTVAVPDTTAGEPVPAVEEAASESGRSAAETDAPAQHPTDAVWAAATPEEA